MSSIPDASGILVADKHGLLMHAQGECSEPSGAGFYTSIISRARNLGSGTPVVTIRGTERTVTISDCDESTIVAVVRKL